VPSVWARYLFQFGAQSFHQGSDLLKFKLVASPLALVMHEVTSFYLHLQTWFVDANKERSNAQV